jgi:integrase
MYTEGHVPVHKGRITTTEPIKDITLISQIKDDLNDNPRDLALFTLGVNSAFRASDILELRRDQLDELPDGRYEIFIREKKTGKLRRVILNNPTSQVLRNHLENSHGDLVFEGQRGKISVSYLARLVKRWTGEVGLEGRFSTHTLRKTFAHAHYKRGASLATLMFCLNHDSERTTMRYLGLVDNDVAKLYADAI